MESTHKLATCRTCGKQQEAVIVIGKPLWASLEVGWSFGVCVECERKERERERQQWFDSFEWRDMGDPIEYVREHEASYVLLRCPFCSAIVKAYVWSISGRGKKCECGALLTLKNARRKQE